MSDNPNSHPLSRAALARLESPPWRNPLFALVQQQINPDGQLPDHDQQMLILAEAERNPAVLQNSLDLLSAELTPDQVSELPMDVLAETVLDVLSPS